MKKIQMDYDKIKVKWRNYKKCHLRNIYLKTKNSIDRRYALITHFLALQVQTVKSLLYTNKDLKTM